MRPSFVKNPICWYICPLLFKKNNNKKHKAHHGTIAMKILIRKST